MFKDSDFSWLKTIECLKSTGMSLKEIRQYIERGETGDTALRTYYQTAVEAGTSQVLCHEREAYLEKLLHENARKRTNINSVLRIKK